MPLNLASILGEGVGKVFTEVKDDLVLSPEKKAELEQHVQDLQAAAQQADQDLEAKLNDIAGQNIRADSSSGDSFVRRARPYFLWIMGTALGANLFLPLLNNVFGGHMKPLDIPGALYELYGACMLGYSYLRTKEKLQDKD